MDSVSAVPSVAGISALFKTLSAESPQFAAILATPKLKSALNSASPSDIVELSAQALQLQQVGVLFGDSDSTQATGANSGSNSLLSLLSPNSSDGADLIAQALQNSADGGAAAALTSTSPASSQPDLAGILSNSQSSQIASLFSIPSSTASTFSAFG
jgi:hypothetical protein